MLDPGRVKLQVERCVENIAETHAHETNDILIGRKARNVAVEMLHTPDAKCLDNFVSHHSDIVNWDFE